MDKLCCLTMYKEKWGHLSDQVSSGKSPEGQELVSPRYLKAPPGQKQPTTSWLWPCAFVNVKALSMNEWTNSTYGNKKWKTPHFQQTKWFFKLGAQTCPTSLEITHWHSFPIGTSLLHHLTFFLSTTSWRVATDSARTSKKGLLGSVRFHTFLVRARTSRPNWWSKEWPVSQEGPRGYQGYQGYQPMVPGGYAWKTLNKMVENQLMLTSRDL